nr:hypothetical protein [Tanacetum cinerariifolium]
MRICLFKDINETPAQKAAKRRRLNQVDKDVEEIKQHLVIVPDEDDDVYTEATPLARKVLVMDYQVVHLNNKPCYKIIRADETHQLILQQRLLCINGISVAKERFTLLKKGSLHPEEESSAKTSDETKSKDKGKCIMVEDPKPIKKKQQVEIDEAYARKLHEEINQDIDWDVAIEHNTAGFKLDYFKGKSYDDIRLIFKSKFNMNIEFLLKSKEQIEEEENRALESINETPAQKAAKRRRLNQVDKDVEEIK